jgi:hypothetical protein
MARKGKEQNNNKQNNNKPKQNSPFFCCQGNTTCWEEAGKRYIPGGYKIMTLLMGWFFE